MLKIRGEIHGKDGMFEFAIIGEKVEMKQQEHGVILRFGTVELEIDKKTFEVLASEILKASKTSST